MRAMHGLKAATSCLTTARLVYSGATFWKDHFMSLGSEISRMSDQLGSGPQHSRGIFMVAAAAFCWSTGGLIVRHVETDQWNIVFWRGFFAAVTLLIYLSIRDGRRFFDGFRALGLPGLAVAACFAIASL